MFRTIKAVAIIIRFLIFSTLFHKKEIEKIQDDRARAMKALPYVQQVFQQILQAAGVTYEVEGLENLPDEEAVMIVGNHRSFFDVVIGYCLVKEPTGFIAKTELQKVPMLARWMNYLGCLFIDRDNLKQSLKVIISAIKMVKEGHSIWIYPEGTRSEGEEEADLLPFKEGSFKIAEKTGCRIVPVAMIHTREILEAHFPKIVPQHVKIRIGTPIDLKTLGEDERKHLGSYTRNVMAGYIREMKEKE